MSVREVFYSEFGAGGFTRVDGTVQFYTRINALLKPDMVVVDLGAGRGLASEVKSPFVRALATIRGKVKRVIGVDLDDAVMQNPIVDEAIVFDGGRIPLEDSSVDIVISDNVIEHVQDPEIFSEEVGRILRPGGWFCARTPYMYSALVIASSMIPNGLHTRVLRRVQPLREERDVFPTCYKMNTRSAIRKYFRPEKWKNCSYTWSPEPAYHFNKRAIFALFMLYQYLKRPIGGEYLLVFVQKR